MHTSKIVFRSGGAKISINEKSISDKNTKVRVLLVGILVRDRVLICNKTKRTYQMVKLTFDHFMENIG